MNHILNAKGPAATPKEIASHYNVIMMAGAVTTATFLSGVLYYLGINRHALGKLQDEIRSVFSDIEAIDSKSLLSCIYLNAVVEEGLRIYPPAGAAHLSRIVPKGGCEISGSFMPEGVGLSSSNQSLRTLISTPLDPRLGPSLVRSARPGQFPLTLAVHSRALDWSLTRRPKGR